MNYKNITSKICRLGLEKLSKDYTYNMAEISDDQWKSLAKSIILGNEKMLEDQMKAIQTAFLKVKFLEGRTDKSAIANILLNYTKADNELVEISKKFDVDGIVDEENEFLDDEWSEIAYRALNFPYKNSCVDAGKPVED